LQDDLEHVLLNLSAEKKRGSLLLAGAEKILRKTDSFPASVTDGTAVFDGSALAAPRIRRIAPRTSLRAKNLSPPWTR